MTISASPKFPLNSIKVIIRRVIRVSSQVTEVLHQHKRLLILFQLLFPAEASHDYARAYVDRIQYGEANIANGVNSTSEFQGAFFIILNVAVGGNFVGSPDGSTVFPQQMEVDWVRVWGI